MRKLSLILIGLVISSAIFGSSFIEPSKPKPVNCIADILQTIDPNILPHSPIEPQGDLQSSYIQVLSQKATEIRNYIASTYSEDLSNLSDREIIVLAIILVPFETRDMLPSSMSNEEIFDCMMTAVGAATGISALVSAWNSGASTSTILSVLKSILKVSYGWFAVGYAVYKFGDCVGWW